MIDHNNTTIRFNDIPLVSCNGYTYMKGSDAAAGDQIWRTDGTGDGTVRLEAVDVGIPKSAACLNSKALFVTAGTTLRVTGGTPQSTTPIRQFEYVSSLMSFGDNVIFVATDKTTGTALWISNGIPEGTRALTPLPVPQLNAIKPFLLTTLGQTIFLVGGDFNSQTYRAVDGITAGRTQIGQVTSAYEKLPVVIGGSNLCFIGTGSRYASTGNTSVS